jgi:LytS/YehU family sensor histidine kinase
MTVLLLAFQMAYPALREQTSRLKISYANERATQLSALRFQLNPHFLFNALNSLSSLVVLGRPAQAEEMIARLSDFLRATLGEPSDVKVELDAEFDMLDAYLDVERVRFQDRMQVRLDLPGELRKALVPPFLLQPLVENAVKYGVAASHRTVTITISAQYAERNLLLVIEDDGDCHASSGGSGVGLANIRERLAIIYGERARLDTRPGTKGGFQASITLPLERASGPPPSADCSRTRSVGDREKS